jgi:hypothetical protein
MKLGQIIEDYQELSDTKVSRGKPKASYDEICRLLRNGISAEFGEIMARDFTHQAHVDFVIKKGETNAPDARYRAIFEILAHTGMRKGKPNKVETSGEGTQDVQKLVIFREVMKKFK